MSTSTEKSQAIATSTDAEKSPYQVEAPGADAIPAAEQAFSPSPPRQKWYQCFAPDDTPEERRLIIKLDCLIMIFFFLAYWAKVLDSSATSTAYMTPFSATYFIPGADLIWGVLTLLQYKVTNVHQLYVIRFFVGAAGSLFFPAVQWYLGCWYKRSELRRRGALFFIASQIGGMSSGYIQSGAHATLDGKHGIEGFGCTIPVALLGFLALPGQPDNCKSRILTPREIELAQARMAKEHREPRKPLTWSLADGVSSNSGLSLWLKEEGYSVESINTITTVSPAVTIVASIICGILSDAYDAKVSLIATTAVLNIFASLILAIWNVPIGLKFFAFFLSGSADGIAAVIYAWANEICAGDEEERAIVISSMNTIGNTFGAWLPLFVWKTVDAPRYHIGYNWTIALDLCMLGMLFVLRSFWKREQKASSG
ncbi:hypothetical protein LA080_006677 [Diaporthe eres]|nr:hypothetical protein LA080_006677 [Diaporthe eres]